MKKHYDFSQARRGAVTGAGPKERITIRLDPDIIVWFKTQVHEAGGGNYQSLINQALHEYIMNQEDNFENTLRRVIREELRQAK